ncbi:MAG: helix-turn-helix domain-containing protein [Lachnospiraceae bacterium]|nr:helix-turn-helix domain-containing protein [Lachnospiraceae bacterium]
MRIKEIRIQKNITQKDLADAVGINMSVLSRYENGKTEPTAKRLVEIAKALDVDVDYLLGTEENNDVISIERRESIVDEKRRLRHYASLLQNDFVKRMVILGAGGKCELCGQDAPFKDQNGRPYLEIHPLYDDYDIDREEIEKKLVALCPNCNSKINVLKDSVDIERLKEIASRHDY